MKYDEHGRPIQEAPPAAATPPPTGRGRARRTRGSRAAEPTEEQPAADAPTPPPGTRERRLERHSRPVQADPVVAERFSRDSMRLGGILTAMVTPFDADGRLDEDAAVRLMHHLLENGSDGLVLAGSTGEGATMTDEEKVRLWELGVAESGDAPIIAGTGTYDTRHSVELTERAHEAGVDAMLVVTPYYVRPNRRGIKAHYAAVAAATDRPIVAYNIPSRTATDMPNDLLAELAADRQRRRREAGSLRGHGADRGHGPARRQRRRARQGHGHGRHRRDPRGVESGRPRDAPDHRRARPPARDRGRAARPLQGAHRDGEPDPGQDRAQHDRPARSAGCGCRSWRRRRKSAP